MKNLLELTSFITPNKLKALSVITAPGKKSTKLERFYYHLSRGDIATDEDAMALLYPDGGSKSAYHKLKHQLTERLYNSAFFIDAKKTKLSERQSADLECQYLICLTRILGQLRARKNAIKLGTRALKLAQKNELIFEEIYVSKMLAAMHTFLHNTRRALELLDRILELQTTIQYETIAEIGCQKVVNLFITDRGNQAQLVLEADQFIQRLEEVNLPKHTHRSIYWEYSLRVYRYFLAADYHETIKICHKAIQLLDEAGSVERNYITFFLHLSASEIAAGNFAESIEAVKRLVNCTTPGSFNWRKAQELLFLTLVQSNEYQRAYDVYHTVTTDAAFRKSPVETQEIWTIYQAYLYLFQRAGWITDEYGYVEKFKLRRYLNSVPTFSKDKRGLNVPILVSHILLLIEMGRHDELIDRFEAIGKYKTRYISRNDNPRSNLFITMLLVVAKGDFNPKRIERRAEKYYDRLVNIPFDVTNQRHDQEIIPYQNAWQLALFLLRRRQEAQ